MRFVFCLAVLAMVGCGDPTGCCTQGAGQCASPITKAQCDALEPPGDWVDGKNCDANGACV